MATGRLQNQGIIISAGGPENVNDASTAPWVTGQLGKWAWVYPQSSYWSTFNLAQRPIAVQYVKRSATDAATLAVGALAFVKDFDDFVVTSDSSDSVSDANNIYNCVGVFLNASLTAGNYGFIAIGGIAPVLIKATPTVTPNALGNLVAVPLTTADLSADAIGATQLNATTGTPSETTAADKLRQIVAKIISAKNTPSGIGTNVVKGILFPYGGVGGF